MASDSSAVYALIVSSKLLFLFCIVMQCVLWPCVATILVTVLHGLWGLAYYKASTPAEVMTALRTPGVFLVARNDDRKAYVHMVIMAVYFCVFFLLFSDETMRHVGAMVPWIPPTLFGNYSFDYAGHQEIKGLEVTSSLSSTMRKESYVWPREYTASAPSVQGAIAGVGPQGATLTCPSDALGKFQCYAKFMDATEKLPPKDNDWVGTHPFVPLPSQLYDVDLLVSPPAGTTCEQLEVYRVALDRHRMPMVPLDYPSSTTTVSADSTSFNEHSNLFGNPLWSLGQKHTFTKQEYAAAQAKQCTQYGGQLVMRLPARVAEVDLATGYMSTDVLLVTAGATVTLHAKWAATEEANHWYMSPFKLLVQDDKASALRSSTDNVDLFGKYFVAITPLLMLWYYLTFYYGDSHFDKQVSRLSIFVLLPSVLFFLSVGAYFPLAGALFVLVAVHFPTEGSAGSRATLMRPAFMFVTAATNSIEFAWLLALATQAGWSAFYYEYTLEQLYNMSFQFVITDASSPTWVALFMPGLLLTTFVYLLGCSLGVVMEVLVYKGRS